MSLPVTVRDDSAPTGSPVFELWNYCPYLECGGRTNAGGKTHFCGACGSAFNVCPNCRATNRLLAGFCRGCGQKLETQAWPMESGLHSNPIQRSSIKSLTAVQAPFPVQLGAGVQVSPIAADGLIVIAQSDGGVVLMSEHTGDRIGELSVGCQIEVTPALQVGMLFVAGGKAVQAFDLASFLDQRSLKQLAPAWNFSVGSEAICQPLLVDEAAVYLLTRNSQQTVLYAVSQEDGARVWAAPLVLDADQTGPPLLVGDQIVLVSAVGHVSVVDAATGDISQSFSLNRSVDLQVAPFVVHNRIFLSDPKGHVFDIVLDRSGPLINPLYDAGTRISSIAASNEYIALGHLAGVTLLSSRGNLQWVSETQESVSTTPIIAGESVFVLDDGGNGLLFNALKANPVERVRLLPGEVGMSPLMTHSRIVVVGAEGKVVALDWQ